MSEFTEAGEMIVNTSEYAEVLSLILAEAQKQTEFLTGIYATQWVIVGAIAGVICLYAIYKITIT